MLSLTTSHETGMRDLPLKRIQSTCRSWVWRSQHKQSARNINLKNSSGPCLVPDRIEQSFSSHHISVSQYSNGILEDYTTFESMIRPYKGYVLSHTSIWPNISHITDNSVLSEKYNMSAISSILAHTLPVTTGGRAMIFTKGLKIWNVNTWRTRRYSSSTIYT